MRPFRLAVEVGVLALAAAALAGVVVGAVALGAAALWGAATGRWLQPTEAIAFATLTLAGGVVLFITWLRLRSNPKADKELD